jgi:hypothetical protein
MGVRQPGPKWSNVQTCLRLDEPTELLKPVHELFQLPPITRPPRRMS